jgi:hypothetical protein
MNGTPSQGPRNVVAREIGGWRRAALAAVGLMSWLAGGAAAFLSKNGAGAAALVAAGTVCGVLALMDRRPSRISMSGNELSWDDVKETVDSQIEVAEKSGDASDALGELKELRERLDVLQRTGSVPDHPAETYDKDVWAALQRLLPGAEIIRQGTGRNDIADFLVRHRGDQLLVETKWRADTTRPFGGTTLPRLTQKLSPDDKLLVVVNTDQWRPGATKNVEDVLGDRGRVVTWRDVTDDHALGEAVRSLLQADKRPGSQ